MPVSFPLPLLLSRSCFVLPLTLPVASLLRRPGCLLSSCCCVLRRCGALRLLCAACFVCFLVCCRASCCCRVVSCVRVLRWAEAAAAAGMGRRRDGRAGSGRDHSAQSRTTFGRCTHKHHTTHGITARHTLEHRNKQIESISMTHRSMRSLRVGSVCDHPARECAEVRSSRFVTCLFQALFCDLTHATVSGSYLRAHKVQAAKSIELAV